MCTLFVHDRFVMYQCLRTLVHSVYISTSKHIILGLGLCPRCLGQSVFLFISCSFLEKTLIKGEVGILTTIQQHLSCSQQFRSCRDKGKSRFTNAYCCHALILPKESHCSGWETGAFPASLVLVCNELHPHKAKVTYSNGEAIQKAKASTHHKATEKPSTKGIHKPPLKPQSYPLSSHPQHSQTIKPFTHHLQPAPQTDPLKPFRNPHKLKEYLKYLASETQTETQGIFEILGGKTQLIPGLQLLLFVIGLFARSLLEGHWLNGGHSLARF